MDAADEKCCPSDTALAVLADNKEGQEVCTFISKYTGAISTRSEKMRTLVEQAQRVLTYRPAHPTVEQNSGHQSRNVLSKRPGATER